MSFKNSNLRPEILRALEDKGYEAPTPIQAEAIPAILAGHDILGAAQTGTGKTAGFTLPLLQLIAGKGKVQRKHVKVLMVAPTRELAAQIHDNVLSYSKYLKISSAVVFGGVNIKGNFAKLKNGVDILVATPGRLLDLNKQRGVNLSEVKHLVMDEADRMLDMGFLPDINRIVNLLPKKRQTLMFSATFSKDIRNLASQFLHEPISIDVAPRNAAAEKVNQEFYLVDKAKKTDLLEALFKKENWYQALCFTRTKYGADKVARKLKKVGIKAAVIHGDKSQNHRVRALADFKANKVEILVATDIAARGLDIKELPHVVNFDVSQQPEDHIHRIGRTGRAGEEGHAVSFVSQDEEKYFRAIEKLLKISFNCKTQKNLEPSFTLRDHHVTSSKQPRRNNNNQTSNTGGKSGTKKRSNNKNRSKPGSKPDQENKVTTKRSRRNSKTRSFRKK
jgi:ATP-dependent RNA helicase RhlE